jgi:predicted HTH domain antitoxin
MRLSEFTLHSMNNTVSLQLPQDVLTSARMTVADVRLELAVALFNRDRLSMGKAAEFAELPITVFQSQLALRGIGPHYGVADALEDAEVLAKGQSDLS